MTFSKSLPKAIAIALLIVAVTLLGTVHLVTFTMDGGHISKKTEEKYLRNLHRYSERGLPKYRYLTAKNGGDSLADIDYNTFYILLPTTKYNIEGVGLIRRGTRLHHLVDSIFNIKRPNNYE
jgi:uncharacterized protein YneF (UPF0154 family)